MNSKPNNIQSFLLHDDGTFPNHPHWPLMVYPSAVSLSPDEPAGSVEAVFRRNGWGGMWRNGIYSFHHYHSNTHEVLGVYSGTARVQFGGPQGVTLELNPGDVAVLPAGTAHCNLGSSADLGVVGAYPSQKSYDLFRGDEDERDRAMENIRKVPRPEADPVFGQSGGVKDLWPAESRS